MKVNPDLVIMDLMLGGEKHGWQLAQKMRMSRDTEHIPIIICTAASDQIREQEGWLTAQAVKVVLKPFKVPHLEHAIRQALDLTDVTASAPEPTPSGQFVLGLDGQAVGHTHGHGRTLHWWE